MVKKSTPSQRFLRRCFDYEPETGTLQWRWRPADHFIDERQYHRWNSLCAYKRAGTVNPTNGYRQVVINGRSYAEHRIIWKLMTDEEPPSQIDHRDGRKQNNRWKNLRLATASENQHARQRRQRDMPIGVRKRTNRQAPPRFEAAIRVKGKQFYLGRFSTVEEAAAAYKKAERQHFGDFGR